MHAGEVDQILGLPANIAIPRLIEVPEGQWFDRKSGRVRPKDLAITLTAFGNAEGGVVVVGLHDGAIEGVSPARVNELRQASIDYTQPPVRVHCDEIRCQLRNGQQGVVLVVHVDPGESVHELTNGECYLRVGDESRRLTFAQRQELHYDRGSPPYDGTAASVPLAGLSAAQTRTYADSIGSSTIAGMLQARSLLTPQAEVTVAAYLLFAEHPQELLPHAYVRVLRYGDTERGTGRAFTLEDDAEARCEGPIPAAIRQATDIIERWMPKRRALGSSGRFEAIPIIPRDAWLEGLVNAVLHRSYSMSGDHIRVEIFPDRVEIESPGRFPGLVNPERPLDIARYARNPRITRVCTDLRISQELGEGIKRIFAEMRHRGLTEPIYVQTAGSVRLVLSAADAVPAALREHLPRGADRVLDGLRRAGRPLGTGEVAELVGLSRPAAGRHLSVLRDVGLVMWDGKSPKDPRATWKVT